MVSEHNSRQAVSFIADNETLKYPINHFKPDLIEPDHCQPDHWQPGRYRTTKNNKTKGEKDE